MKIAIISDNDFGFANALKIFNHDVKSYECVEFATICGDIADGYKPDCIFLMDNGKIPPAFWNKESIESHFFFNPTLVYFTRESSGQISENDSKKIMSSDVVFTQNTHWIVYLAYKRINVYRFPYWVDLSILSPDDTDRKYDCISSTTDLDMADSVEAKLSQHGMSFFNNPVPDYKFYNSGKVFLNLDKNMVPPRELFEASACGLPFISIVFEQESEMEALFEEEREIIYFSSLDECVQRAYVYVRSQRQRELLAKKTFYLIEKYHTIEKRVRKFIKEIKILRS